MSAFDSTGPPTDVFERGNYIVIGSCGVAPNVCCACCAVQREQLAWSITKASLSVLHDAPATAECADSEAAVCPECALVCIVPSILVTSARNRGLADTDVSDDEYLGSEFDTGYAVSVAEIACPFDESDGKTDGLVRALEQHAANAGGEHDCSGDVCIGGIPPERVLRPEFVAAILSRFPRTTSDHPCDIAVPVAWLQASYSTSDLVPHTAALTSSAKALAALVRDIIRRPWPSQPAAVVDYLAEYHVDIHEVDTFLAVSTLRGYRGTMMPWAATSCVCSTAEFNFAAAARYDDIPFHVATVFAERWGTVGVSPAEALLVVAMAKNVELAEQVFLAITPIQGPEPKGFIPARAVEAKFIGLLCAHMRVARPIPSKHRRKRVRLAGHT